MLTVQYKGKGERTIGGLVVYPGELLTATPNLLAAWQAEHGDVFVLVGGEAPVATQPAETETDQADQATDAAPKGKRK